MKTEKLVYCRSCLIPNTRPNGRFNKNGICIPCEFAQQSKEVNYLARFDELRQLVARKTRGRRLSRWQCIVGVSGGKDSTRQALWVREKLGLNPLLVSVAYPPKQISQVGVDNLSNLINLGFDTLVLGPAPRLSRALVREAFLRFCNWFKATEMALFSGVPQMAIEKNIPLILWGENPALQVGEMGVMGSSIWDGNKMVNSNTLAGGDLTWFRDVAKNDRLLMPYKFPSAESLKRAGVQIYYLGPAWEDWGNETNSIVAMTYGLRPREDDNPRNTADLLGTGMIDEDFSLVNMLLKYYKFGFSRGTEFANVYIRLGWITRQQGIPIAEAYDDACSKDYINSFCRYIDITETRFWEVVKKFANSHLFDLSGRRPVKKFRIGYGMLES